MLLKKQFLVSPSVKRWGYIHLPDDYETNPGLCPLVIFNHGVGESGSTEAEADRLLLNGPLYFAKLGEKFVFKNSLTGKDHRFIIIAIQHPNWSPSSDEIAYCLQNDIFLNYQIDKNCILITGLSAGGASTLQAITNPNSLNLYSSAVPMSPASSGNTQNIALTAGAKIRSWGFSGINDGTFTQNLQSFDAKLNSVAAGSARSFIYPGAHGGWNAYYDPAYRSGIWSNAPINIYEFALLSSKGSAWVPSAPPSNTVVAVISPIQDNAVINTLSASVDGLASQNVSSAYDGYRWDIKPTFNGGWNVNFQDGIFGPKKTIINLVDGGAYQLSLTVKDNSGKTNTAVVNFTVKLSTAPPPPPPPPAKTLTSVATSLVNGKLTAILTYSDGSQETKQ
jgi:hypothetical protein